MKYVGLILNNKKDRDFVYFKKIAELLHNNGFIPVVTKEYRNVLPDDRFVKVSSDELFQKVSIVISLGGDGTLLNLADKAVRYGIPILGVNLGKLGYLAQLDKSEIDRIPEILKEDFKCQSRMMLEVSVIRRGEVVYNYHALNDAVVTRTAVLKPINVELHSSTGVIADYFCDGLIFSTPTGSSAYSLSVGGPIMDPTMEAILVSAISPHSLSSHSLVFNPDKDLACYVHANKSINSLISVDGRHVFYLEAGDRIQVKKSDKYLKLLQLTDCDFYTVLKSKFSSRGSKR